MKKTILLLIFAIIVIIAILGYMFVYGGHRDIGSEEAQFTMSTGGLVTEFVSNDSLANVKYADKTIVVSGMVTSFDNASNSAMIDDKMSVTFKDKTDLVAKSSVSVKGRFVGYDDLLGELKMDQASIIKK